MKTKEEKNWFGDSLELFFQTVQGQWWKKLVWSPMLLPEQMGKMDKFL